MNKRNIFTKLSIVIVLAALISTGAVWQIRRVHANPLPTAVESQTSFGTVGLSTGQTMRVSVANISLITVIPPPCNVLINFRDMNGDLVRNRNGQVIFREVQLDPGQSAFLDLHFGQIPSPVGTNAINARFQLRPVITTRLLATPTDPEFPPPCVPVVEVIDSITGRTQFVMAGPPVVQQLTSTVGTN
jgi:hypothetical protein